MTTADSFNHSVAIETQFPGQSWNFCNYDMAWTQHII